MIKDQKDQRWVFYKDTQSISPAPGVIRKVGAFCETAMCAINEFEKGAVGQLHSHPHTQITYIGEGRFRFTIGDETREVGKGDTLYKVSGVKHGCECLEKGFMVDFFTPMREDFLS